MKIIKNSKITRFLPSPSSEDGSYVALSLAGVVDTESLALPWAQGLVACPEQLGTD